MIFDLFRLQNNRRGRKPPVVVLASPDNAS